VSVSVSVLRFIVFFFLKSVFFHKNAATHTNWKSVYQLSVYVRICDVCARNIFWEFFEFLKLDFFLQNHVKLKNFGRSKLKIPGAHAKCSRACICGLSDTEKSRMRLVWVVIFRLFCVYYFFGLSSVRLSHSSMCYFTRLCKKRSDFIDFFVIRVIDWKLKFYKNTPQKTSFWSIFPRKVRSFCMYEWFLPAQPEWSSVTLIETFKNWLNYVYGRVCACVYICVVHYI
jgi:hypothetical protein